MNPLTLKRMLKLSLELWSWFTANPDKEKEEWPRWERNGGDIPAVPNDCFCCQYVKEQTGQLGGDHCLSVCPMRELFGGFCLGWDWYNLKDTDPRKKLGPEEIRRRYGQIIADWCQQKLRG